MDEQKHRITEGSMIINEITDVEQYNTSIEYVRDNLGRPAILENVAEEAAELAQAASKLARILRGENPAGTTLEEALDNLKEEFDDVMLTGSVAGLFGRAYYEARKLERWVSRLKSRITNPEE